jgi:formate dehydrogenase assembly factor FdhD
MNAKRPACAAPALDTPAPAASQSYSYSDLQRNESASTALAEEVALAIAYNGISQAVMLVTPTDLEDFIVGFSLGSGIIEDVTDIYDLQLTGAGSAQYAPSGISSNSAGNWPAPVVADCAVWKQWNKPCPTSKCCPAHHCHRLNGSTACVSASVRSSHSASTAARCTRRCS